MFGLPLIQNINFYQKVGSCGTEVYPRSISGSETCQSRWTLDPTWTVSHPFKRRLDLYCFRHFYSRIAPSWAPFPVRVAIFVRHSTWSWPKLTCSLRLLYQSVPCSVLYKNQSIMNSLDGFQSQSSPWILRRSFFPSNHDSDHLDSWLPSRAL